MKRTIILGIVTSVFIALLAIEPAMAGPGGKIARAAFETFWGRVALGVLTIVFLPLITYVLFLEKLSERRARKDLRFMAGYSSLFEWLKVQERAKDCFFRVHSGWEKEDLSEVSNWMTDWYWQNQQLAHLDRWKKGELKLDLSSDCQRFQTGLIFSQQHRPSRTDITNQTGFKKAVEGNAP